MTTKIKIEGLKESISKLKEFSKESREIVNDAVIRFGKVAESEIKREIDRQKIIDTGRLRREVNVDTRVEGVAVVTSKAFDPETKIDYAPIQEYGGRFHRERPYFYPSIIKAEDDFIDNLSSKLRKLTK